MNTITLTVEIIADKREEFIQAIRSVNELLKKQKGFKDSILYQNMDNANNFNLIQKWETQEDMENQIRSETFRVLMGALKTLTRSSKVEYNLKSKECGQEIPIS